MCLPRCHLGCGCSARAGQARTTPTTRARLRSPGCATPDSAWSPVKITPLCCGCWSTATTTSLHCVPRPCAGVHATLCALAPGGLGRTLSTVRAAQLLRTIRPTGQVQTERKTLAQQLLDDVRRLDAQLAASKARIQVAVAASGTTVTEVYGVGPIVAALLIGHSGDIRRFASKDRYASYNATAPIQASSGPRVRHRLNPAGNRQLNHALHVAAVTQVRNDTPGRAYYQRKLGRR
jgi:transposase IS116/IS110/IS902 family protein